MRKDKTLTIELPKEFDGLHSMDWLLNKIEICSNRKANTIFELKNRLTQNVVSESEYIEIIDTATIVLTRKSYKKVVK
jgi:hypothetical protein